MAPKQDRRRDLFSEDELKGLDGKPSSSRRAVNSERDVPRQNSLDSKGSKPAHGVPDAASTRSHRAVSREDADVLGTERNAFHDEGRAVKRFANGRLRENGEAHGRFAMDPRTGRLITLAIIVFVVFWLVVILPDGIFDINNKNLSPAWFVQVFSDNVGNVTRFVTGGGSQGSIEFVIFRYLIIGLAGAALAMSGTVYQGSLRNALASPSTLGVMSGASVGAVAYTLTSMLGAGTAANPVGTATTLSQVDQAASESISTLQYIWLTSQRSFYVLAGSFIVVICVLFVTKVLCKGHASDVTLIIVGQVVAALASSLIVVVQLYLEVYGSLDQIQAIATVLMGDFSSTFTLLDLVLVGSPLLICMAVLICMRNQLNLLALSEDEARTMGVNVGLCKFVVVLLTTVMTAVVVAFCGVVGFIGFVVPHFTRRILGPDFKYLVPASALVGGMYLMVVYYVLHLFTIPSGSLSAVTTFIGAIAFVYVVYKQRRVGNASW